MLTNNYWILLALLATASSIAAQSIARDPENATICIGGTATLYCRFVLPDLTFQLETAWEFNNSIQLTLADLMRNQTGGFPFQLMVDGDDRDNVSLIIGPVDDRFLGQSSFTCNIVLQNSITSRAAILTVLAIPPEYPPMIIVGDVTQNSISISWTISENDTNSICAPVRYNVTMATTAVTNTTGSLSMISYTGLSPSTTYTIIVTPYNNAGAGPPANITVTTLPPTVTGVDLSLMFVNRSVNITGTWMAPKLAPTAVAIDNYTLALTVNATSLTITVPANTTSVDIFDAFPTAGRTRFTRYSLSVVAINSAGTSHFSNPVMIASNYIQEVSVTPVTGKIAVLCILAQSVPNVTCAVSFNCTIGESLTYLQNDNLTDFSVSSVCNVTVKVVLLDDFSETLEQLLFNNVLPLTPSRTPQPSVISPTGRVDNQSTNKNIEIIAGIVGGVVIATIVLFTVCALLIYCKIQYSTSIRITVKRKDDKNLHIHMTNMAQNVVMEKCPAYESIDAMKKVEADYEILSVNEYYSY